MIAIFIIGCFITSIVGGACWCVVAGLRTDMHEREGRTREEGSKRSEGISEPRPRLP